MADRLVIIASGIPSPLSSALEFANRARALGSEVTVFAPAAAAAQIAFAGFEHRTIPNPRINAFEPLLPPASERRPDRKKRLDAAVSALGVDDLQKALLRSRPAVVFVDCELHAHIIVALSLDCPVVQYSNMFLSPPGLRAPPLHKVAYPGRGLRGSRLGVLTVWTRYLFRKASKILKNRVANKGADYPSAILELAHRYDVPARKLIRLVSWQMPWTYRIPTVLLLPRALDLPTRPYPNLTYLGPMILQSRPEKEYDRERVSRFCEPGNGKKRIFVGFGTIMKPESALVTRIWEVARRHPEWRFLYAAGKDWDEFTKASVPENVDVVSWAPQHRVLENADLAILHGGTGGLVEAVEAATPMLLYPHINDQRGSAARVVFHGIGRAGKRNDPMEKIESDMRFLLDSPEAVANCEIMQSASRVEIEDDSVGRYLKQLLSEQAS